LRNSLFKELKYQTIQRDQLKSAGVSLALPLMLGEHYITNQYYDRGREGEGRSLSVVAGRNSFMYAVFTADFDAVTEIGHLRVKDDATARLSNELPAILDNFRLTVRQFSKVYLAFQTPSFVMLPEAYAIENAVKPLLKFTSGSEPSMASLSHHIGSIQLTFEPPQAQTAELERLFSQAHVRHSGAVNISLLMRHPALASCEVLLTESDGCLEICARRGNDLLYYNLFETYGNEDVLYYLLFMLEQHGISPSEVSLCLSCQRAVTDPLIRDIRKYVKHTDLVNAGRQKLKRGGEIAGIPEHYYFTLLQQHTCEL
jgi:hypothetical protein